MNHAVTCHCYGHDAGFVHHLFIVIMCIEFKIHYVSIRNSKWCALFGIYIYIYQQSIYQQSIYYIYIMSDIIYILSGENATIGFEPCTHDQIFP